MADLLGKCAPGGGWAPEVTWREGTHAALRFKLTSKNYAIGVYSGHADRR